MNNEALIDQEQKLLKGLLLIIIFLFKTFSIFEISNPPNLNIFGLFLTSIMVDSSQLDDFPPSSTYLNFFPKIILYVSRTNSAYF